MFHKDEIVNQNAQMLEELFIAEKVNMIPALSDKRLSFGKAGLTFDATVIHLKLKNPSLLLKSLTPKDTAKIHTNIFNTVVHIAANFNGEVRSYDGESLLVFFRDTGRSVINMAVQAALVMKYMLALDENSVGKYLLGKFDINLDFGIGIDCGTVLCSKMCIGGGNNSNLVFTGNCISKSALLSEIRKYPVHIGISDTVYNNLDDKNRYININAGLESKEYMWRLDYLHYNDKTEFCYSTTYCCVV